MKTLIGSFLTTIIFLSSVAFTYGQGKEEFKAIVAGLNKEMNDIYKSAKFDKLENYYDADVVLLPNNRPVEKGFKEILSSFELRNKSGFQVLERATVIESLEVEDGLAIETGTYSMKVAFPGPPEPIMEYGKYLTVWKKQKDDSWKILYGVWNTDKGQSSQQSGGVQASPGSKAPSTLERNNPGSQEKE